MFSTECIVLPSSLSHRPFPHHTNTHTLQDTWRTQESKEAANEKQKEKQRMRQIVLVFEAIENGGKDNLTKVEEFLKNGIDVNCQYPSGHYSSETFLHRAARCKFMAMASLLLGNGACVDAVDSVRGKGSSGKGGWGGGEGRERKGEERARAREIDSEIERETKRARE